MEIDPNPTRSIGTNKRDMKNGASGYLVVYRKETMGSETATNNETTGITMMDEYRTELMKASLVFSNSVKTLNLEKAGNNVTAMDPVKRLTRLEKFVAT
jgi:hypothetical protein